MTGASRASWWQAGLEAALATDGWMKPDELLALMRLARAVPEGALIVEIGTYRGRSTVALAHAAREGNGNRVYTFDPHLEFTGIRGGAFGPRDQAYLYRALADSGVGETVFVVCLDSKVAAASWPAPNVGLLFVDGDHRIEAVRADLTAWLPHLRRDAVIVLDDTDFRDVQVVIQEFLDGGKMEPIASEGKLAWFRALSE
jgi:predicted O-methyltransferase YrrM